MLKRIAEGIWQLEIRMRYNPLGYTYSYLLVDDATLIDTGVGTGEARSALKDQLTKAGLKTSDLKRVILTHLHRDHVGLVDHIKAASDARIYAHEKAVEILREWEAKGRSRYEEMREEMKRLGGAGLLKLLSQFELAFRRRPAPIPIDETLSDSDLLKLDSSRLRVIWTPGHAPEHICLYDAEHRRLFSGDHVLPQITSHVSAHTYEEADPLGDYLNSLEKLHDLPVDLVLPAHEHEFKNLKERIEALIRHHERRCGEIKEALRRGRCTVFEISSKISWDSRPWPLMPFWIKRMAAAETLAHLIYLRNRGEVEEESRDGVLHYSLK